MANNIITTEGEAPRGVMIYESFYIRKTFDNN